MDARDDLIQHLIGAQKALSRIYPEYVVENEHNIETSRRIADTWIEICKGFNPPDFEFTTFENKVAGHPIILKNIHFSSFCQHHFLPFTGKIHIGYIPGDKICGLSKLPRAVEYIASKPQVQETMTDEVACFINNRLEPLMLIVIAEAEHTCVACRGVKSMGGKMITKAVYADYSYSTPELEKANKAIMEMLKYE